MQRDVFLEKRHDAIRQRAHLGARRRICPHYRRYDCADVWSACRHETRNLGTGKTFDKNASAAVRKSCDLENASDYPGAVQICSGWLLNIAFFLRNEEDELVSVDGRIYRG